MVDTRTHRGADVGSDHNHVIAKIKLTMCGVAKPVGTREKYDVNKTNNPEVREEFLLKLRHTFSCLAEGESENGETLNDR